MPICPLIPEHYNVALRYWNDVSYGAAAAYTIQMGLVNWGARTPNYGTNYYGIYNRARILRVDYDLQISSTSTDPFTITLAALQYSAAIPTGDQLQQARTATTVQSGGQGSLNIARIRRSYSPDAVGGTLSQADNLAWYKLSEQAGVPKDTNAPLTWYQIRSLTGLPAAYYVTETVTYHMRYFGLVNTTAPTFDEPSSLFEDEISEKIPAVKKSKTSVKK